MSFAAMETGNLMTWGSKSYDELWWMLHKHSSISRRSMVDGLSLQLFEWMAGLSPGTTQTMVVILPQSFADQLHPIAKCRLLCGQCHRMSQDLQQL